MPEPPERIRYDLDEALTLLGALEDARDALTDSSHVAIVVNIETDIHALSPKLGVDDPAGGTMDAEPLRATDAARLLGIPTRQVLRLIYRPRIRYVTVGGIAHVLADAIDEHRAQAS